MTKLSEMNDAHLAEFGAAGRSARVRRAICTKAGVLGGFASANLSNGAATSATYRTGYRTIARVYGGVRFRFDNWRLFSSGPKFDDLSPYTLQFSAEYGVSYYPLTFGGQPTVTVQPGFSVWSDPIELDLPANSFLFGRSFVSAAPGGRWPLGRYGSGSEGSNLAAGGSNQITGTGNLPSTAADTMFGPSAIEGIVDARAPGVVRSVGLIADSLGAGAAAGGLPGANNEYGIWENALGLKANWMTVSRTGWAMFRLAQAVNRRELAGLDTLVDRVILELGFNDLNGNARTAAQLQADVTTVVGALRARGLVVALSTITPYSQSGAVNSASATAQTIAYNDWVRANFAAIGALFLFDISDLVSTARNSGLWKQQYEPADGIHPDKLITEIAGQVPMNDFLAAKG